MFKSCASKLYTTAVAVVTCASLLSAKTITSTIIVKSGQTYDGKGETITAKGMGDGGQGESQKPIFKLEKGAKLKNVKIGKPGCDGVHCYGDNTVTDVTWLDIGEDALTVKKGGNVTVSGGSARDGADKCFQLNAAGKFTVKNFKATNVGKLIRQNGGKTFKCEIRIENCVVKGAVYNIVRTDSKSTTIYYCNSEFNQTKQEQFMVPNKSQVTSCDGKTDILSPNSVQSSFMSTTYNAATNTLQLGKPATDLIIDIVGLNGTKVMSEHIRLTDSQTEFVLPIGQIRNGTYILKTTADGAVSTQNISIY